MSEFLTPTSAGALHVHVRELLPSERIIWIGKPVLHRAFRQYLDRTLVPMAYIVPFIVAFASCAMVVDSAALLVPTLVLSILNAVFLRRTQRIISAIRAMRYVITTERCIVVTGDDSKASFLGLSAEESFARTDLKIEGKRIRSDGTGDLIFAVRTVKLRRTEYVLEIGFFGIPDARKMEAELRR